MQTKQTLTNKTPPCQPRQHICAVQETQALLSMPGMRDAIHADLAEPLAACAKALDG
jgi:hypothetical protein